MCICGSQAYISCVHTACPTVTRVHWEMCQKNKIFWIFPQWVTNNLTFGLPYAWKCSRSILHFLLKGCILVPLDALEEENWREEGNYSSFVPHSYILESTSLCPCDNPLMIFPSLPLHCEISIEMEDWIGGGLGFSVLTRCWQSLSLLSLFIINRNIYFSSITCVWLWMFYPWM